MTRALALLLAFAAACETTGREPARATLEGEGASPRDVAAGSYVVRLTRAELAIGPLYLCATRAASAERCEVAVLETTSAHVFDALDPTPVELGPLDGVTGTFRTAQFDHGIAFLLGAATAQPVAPADHSLVLEGNASDGTDAFDFVLTLDVHASVSGQTTVVGRPVEGAVPVTGGRLRAAFDPNELVAILPWDDVAALPRPANGPVVIPRTSRAYDVASLALLLNHPVALRYSIDAGP